MAEGAATDAIARCHCGGVEFVAQFPSRFWADEIHLPLALFVTPVDKAPDANAFADERPAWAPFHGFS